MSLDNTSQAYWSATLRLLGGILVVWFLVSFGAGILFAPWLNQFHLGGYPLGFWFAQQGSIYIFIILIFYYGWRMGAIDRRFGVDEEAPDLRRPAQPVQPAVRPQQQPRR